MPLDPHLARHLVARLCHDLGGAVGTLGGVLDLIDPQDPEMLELARETAGALRARLRLFAAAWGGTTDPLDPAAMTELLRGAPSASRVTFDLGGLTGGLSAALVPIALNAALLAGDALPRGGQVSLGGDATMLTLLPEGTDAAWPPELLALLAGTPPEALLAAGPRQVLTPLLGTLLEEAGWSAALGLGAPGTAGAAPLVLLPGP